MSIQHANEPVMHPGALTDRGTPVVHIDRLSIALPEGADRLYAVDRVSFKIHPGEMLCVVGESGSGKSMSANALMGLLPDTVRVAQGRILLEQADLLTLPAEAMYAVRGRRVAMIFQEPMSALNPLMKISAQIEEVFEAHGLLTAKQRKQKALELLTEVGLPDPQRAAVSYPFQLSGGQRQRVVIAMALALEPQVLVADEPTTALDVTTQAQILHLIRDLQLKRNMAVMFITHDFGVVAEIADFVTVMQLGRIVEQGTADEVLLSPGHPYTKKLIAAIPRPASGVTQSVERETILRVEQLNKTYHIKDGIFAKAKSVHAVRDVSFTLGRGETLGIVGESGSGKSSVGRCLVRLQDPDSGRVLLNDNDMAHLKGDTLRAVRRRIQMIFQDPFSSLNPREKVGRIIASGPIAYGEDPKLAMKRAAELMEMVGLDARGANRFPHEFSGGQRQRIGIARALALDPEIIIADEAVSALDVSIQAQVLELLARLKAELNLSLVFITHDLRVAAQICDRVMVMQQGQVVELGSGSNIFNAPTHPYTQKLIAAIPGRAKEALMAS
ncbi:ABC transporter ATP-binding protein [Erwiniaceae bacterium BAC15a-03b]|uniref:ABC transporter ATP-binding protein n=2 Tax=Winslowiella arboricola TaxID=2978220 RepID=A0A9J6PQI5_9GAMM|nr:ABC transporter ATP-binding protein [Winslowiella arboricola]MCU5775444.1 ABC transporter ATP-binding protein [Winslowiella arboricola]MCU5779706.1 ABC transporter ATP-binding protein [Winslowiella arboricola]